MKRGVVFIVTFALLITMLAGCNTSGSIMGSSEKKKPIINEPYKLYLERNLLEDYYTERLGYEVIEDHYFEASQDVPDKTVTLFGKIITFSYMNTCESTVPWRNRVLYQAKCEQTDEFYLASFDSVTGALRSYTDGRAGKNRLYQSEVNEHSSEAEFLAYAKKMVSQYASVEGCEVEIKTELYEFSEKWGYNSDKTVDGYVNNAENVPDFYAVYTFTFYKTIDGVRRYDTNQIEINNTGEVISASLYMQDDAYEDFADMTIDMAQAEQLIYRAVPGGEIVHSLLVATTDGVLWLHFMVYWGIPGGGGSCNEYVIPIAGEYRNDSQNPQPTMPPTESTKEEIINGNTEGPPLTHETIVP